MTKFKQTHSQNRTKCCAICWRKSTNVVNKADIARIRLFVVENYDFHNPNFPSGICHSCRSVLLAFSKGDFSRTLQVSVNFNPEIPRSFRSILDCKCRICKTAQMKGGLVKKMKRQVGPSSKKNLYEGPKRFKLCSKCFGRIYPGKYASIPTSSLAFTIVHFL